MLKMPRFVRSGESTSKNRTSEHTNLDGNGAARIEHEMHSSKGVDEGKQSLNEILLTPLTSDKGRKMVETYTMNNEDESGSKAESTFLIVTRMPLLFNNLEC